VTLVNGHVAVHSARTSNVIAVAIQTSPDNWRRTTKKTQLHPAQSGRGWLKPQNIGLIMAHMITLYTLCLKKWTNFVTV